MQDRPTSDELLRAIREFLQHDVLPEAADAIRFALRVSINALEILERESVSADAHTRNEARRLGTLLGQAVTPAVTAAQVRDMQRDLAAQIRAGAFDHQIPATRELLRQTLIERLSVAHPGWSTIDDDGRE